MSEVSGQDIVAGLKALGLPRGAILMVHSSLSSLGHVEGGANMVIDALLDVLGPEGTLLMPTHPARDGRVFDPETIPSAMGIITETFRLRPGVLRSRHPYHPVAACGLRAAEMLQNHESSIVPDGPQTPYGRLISQGGWVLLVGCDLDTLTLLHAVEAELDLPYLRELEMAYVDERGNVCSLYMERCPGGHRGGVLKFDRLFRKEGAMGVRQIGQAVCRLISAPRAAAIMRRELSRDPSFALDDNPHCTDCVRFRGQIKAARLDREGFRLTAPLWVMPHPLEKALDLVQGEGISWLELNTKQLGASLAGTGQLQSQLVQREFRIATLRTEWTAIEAMNDLCRVASRLTAVYLHFYAPERVGITRPELLDGLERLAQTAKREDVTLLLSNRPASHAETPEELADLIEMIGSRYLKASYDPAGVVLAGTSPFYDGLYKGSLRRLIHHVQLRDVVADGGQAVPLGYGNAQIREIVSNLRCRTFGGFLCLWPLPEHGQAGFRVAAKSFWEILDTI